MTAFQNARDAAQNLATRSRPALRTKGDLKAAVIAFIRQLAGVVQVVPG